MKKYRRQLVGQVINQNATQGKVVKSKIPEGLKKRDIERAKFR